MWQTRLSKHFPRMWMVLGWQPVVLLWCSCTFSTLRTCLTNKDQTTAIMSEPPAKTWSCLIFSWWVHCLVKTQPETKTNTGRTTHKNLDSSLGITNCCECQKNNQCVNIPPDLWPLCKPADKRCRTWLKAHTHTQMGQNAFDGTARLSCR